MVEGEKEGEKRRDEGREREIRGSRREDRAREHRRKKGVDPPAIRGSWLGPIPPWH